MPHDIRVVVGIQFSEESSAETLRAQSYRRKEGFHDLHLFPAFALLSYYQAARGGQQDHGY
jgi:hypothetical protein